VDYSSIPQKHKSSQLLAINSLAVYASVASALIVAVPDAEHVSTGQFASASSYQARAWCRAEQFCYSIRHGTDNLWVASSTDPADVVLADAAWLETCLFVFEGEMTCCAMGHTFDGVVQSTPAPLARFPLQLGFGLASRRRSRARCA
jgi:hypothetical protein